MNISFQSGNFRTTLKKLCMTKKNKLKLLILGGSGFVSGHLVQKALEYGHEVWVLTRGSKPVPAGAISLQADRSDSRAFKKVIEDAGIGWDAVLDCICMNAEAAGQDVEVVRDRTKQLLVISTDIVYEPAARKFPQAEECENWVADGYAGNKRLCELELLNADTGGMSWTILRPGHIFGPGSQLGCLPLHQRDPQLIKRLIAHEPISLVGGGHFLLHPVYVTDLCELMLDLLGNQKARNRIFCVGGPEVIECRKYYQIIADILKVDIKIEDIPIEDFLPSHPEAVPSVCHRIYDLSELKAAGAKMPETSVREGMKLHVDASLK